VTRPRPAAIGRKSTFEKWAELNESTGAPTTQNGCSIYSSCAAGVEVALCTAQGGGHDQGNGSVGWPFLKKHQLP
jgi:polyhydroxybutyrate depolymerase